MTSTSVSDNKSDDPMEDDSSKVEESKIIERGLEMSRDGKATGLSYFVKTLIVSLILIIVCYYCLLFFSRIGSTHPKCETIAQPNVKSKGSQTRPTIG